MNIEQKKVDDLNALLTITLEKDDYYGNYNKTLKSYKKSMTMPGFRTGQVPVSVIKKKYGKGVLAEELQKVLNEAINKHITENKLQVLGHPLPIMDQEVGDWDQPETFKFEYEMGLAPDFEINLSTKHKVEFYRIKVDDKMVNEEMNRMRRRYGKLKDVDVAKEEDMIFGEFVELKSDGLPKEDGIRNESTIGLEYIKDKKTKKKFKGVKVGAEVECDPEKLSHDHDDLGRMLGLTHEQVHELHGAKFKFTVKEIKEMEPAEMNDEFFTKVFGPDSVNSEASMKAKIIEDLTSHFENDSETLFKRDLNRYLSKKLKLSLPDGFLKKWIEQSTEEPMSVEDIEKSYEEYANGLKWQLIKNKLITENEIKVEFEEALEHTKALLKQNYVKYGYPAPDEEQLQETAMKFMQDRKEVERVFDDIYEKRVMAVVKEKAKVNQKEVSFDKFKGLAEK